MAFYSTCAAVLLALTSSAAAQSDDCQSYGIDYEQGGTYFQNKNTNETFTAFQQFDDCQNDVSHNVLVDPNGDQSECSTTPMLPNNEPQLVTCDQWNNQNLYTGDWSLLVVSNNGNATPIAYQRDFHLDVGEPTATVTARPTYTNTFYATKTFFLTMTQIQTSTNVIIPTGTQTESSASMSTTSASTSSIPGISLPGGIATGADGIATLTSYLSKTETVTETGSCKSRPTGTPDQIAQILPSILGELDNVVKDILGGVVQEVEGILGDLKPRATPIAYSAKFKKDIIEGRMPSDEVKRRFVEQRHSKLHPQGIVKRHPDSYTTTIYQGDYITTVDYTSYVSTETQDYTVYETKQNLKLLGRQATEAIRTITTVIPTTFTQTATQTPSC